MVKCNFELELNFLFQYPKRPNEKAMLYIGQASTLSYNVLDGILPCPINTWDCVPNPQKNYN
jgi:hypothetical protein